MKRWIHKFHRLLKNPWWAQIGIPGLFVFTYYRILSRLGFKMRQRHFPIQPRGYEHPFYARFGASDVGVFNQIFYQKEYTGLGTVTDPELIIDCGANVGYASLWFLNQYPNAHVIAIEPDPENMDLCRRNLHPYDKRVSLIRAAVWPVEVGLTVVRQKEGKEWSVQVKLCSNGESPDLYGVDIDRILTEAGFDKIDILKIDIEGAEKKLFSNNYERWLRRVRNIVIELHGQDCEEAFFGALAPYHYHLTRVGELTVCKNIQPRITAALNPGTLAGAPATYEVGPTFG